MPATHRLPVVLLLLRLSVFVVMLIWTLDKFVRPAHAATICKTFYRLPLSAPSLFYLLGGLELVLACDKRIADIRLNAAARSQTGVRSLSHPPSAGDFGMTMARVLK